MGGAALLAALILRAAHVENELVTEPTATREHAALALVGVEGRERYSWGCDGTDVGSSGDAMRGVETETFS